MLFTELNTASGVFRTPFISTFQGFIKRKRYIVNPFCCNLIYVW